MTPSATVTMFGSVDVVVAQSLSVYGAFDPWWVLLWLAMMAGCLLVVAGVVALVRAAATVLHKRSGVQRRLRTADPEGGPVNPKR